MSILKVARMGHPVLRERARPLDKSDIKSTVVQKLIDDMIDTMHEYHGVGLAGPQVHEGLRIFVGMLQEDIDEKSDAAVIINPEIVPQRARDGRGMGRLSQHSRHPWHGAALHRHHAEGARQGGAQIELR